MKNPPPPGSTHGELDNAVLVFANRTLSTGALLTLWAMGLGLVGAQALAFIFDDPTWQIPPMALRFVLGITLPSALAFWLTTRARVLTLRALLAEGSVTRASARLGPSRP